MLNQFRNAPHRVKAAWVGLITSCACWPISQLTWARDEPFTTLALSWLAICLVCVDILINTKMSTDDKD